jgi:hypothetical protein
MDPSATGGEEIPPDGLVCNVQSKHEDLELLDWVGIISRMISDIGREVIVTGLIDCISSMQMSVWLMPEARFTFVFTYRKGKKKERKCILKF